MVLLQSFPSVVQSTGFGASALIEQTAAASNVKSAAAVSHVNARLKALIAGGNASSALQLLSCSSTGPSAPQPKLSTVLALAASGDALQAASELSHLNLYGNAHPDATCSVAELQAAHEVVLAAHTRLASEAAAASAAALVRGMPARGVAPTLGCFKAAIDTASATANWGLMLALFNELQASAKAAEAAESEAGAEETAQSGSGATSTAPGSAAAALRPDLTCYRAVLQALRPARQWQMASRLIEMAIAAGVKLDADCFECAICALFGQPRAWQSALALATRMHHVGILPSSAVCVALIDVLSEACQWQQAVHLLTTFEERGGAPLDERCYAAALRACERSSDWQTALYDLLPRIERHRVPLTVGVLAPLVRVLALGHRARDALHLVPRLLAALSAAIDTSSGDCIAAGVTARVSSLASLALATDTAEALRAVRVACRFSHARDGEAEILKALEAHQLVAVAVAVDAEGTEHRHVERREASGNRLADPTDAEEVALDEQVKELELLCGMPPEPHAGTGSAIAAADGGEWIACAHLAKRALATIVSRGEPSYQLRCNSVLCDGCESFFHLAATCLGRPIHLTVTPTRRAGAAPLAAGAAPSSILHVFTSETPPATVASSDSDGASMMPLTSMTAPPPSRGSEVTVVARETRYDPLAPSSTSSVVPTAMVAPHKPIRRSRGRSPIVRAPPLTGPTAAKLPAAAQAAAPAPHAPSSTGSGDGADSEASRPIKKHQPTQPPQ